LKSRSGISPLLAHEDIVYILIYSIIWYQTLLLVTSRGPLGLHGYCRVRYHPRRSLWSPWGLLTPERRKKVELRPWAKLNKYSLAKLGQVAVSL
jgi:hypothetical protein